jgi:hypothetical protein
MQLGMALKRLVSTFMNHVPSWHKTRNKHFQKPTKANTQNCAPAVLERVVLLTCDSAEQYTSWKSAWWPEKSERLIPPSCSFIPGDKYSWITVRESPRHSRKKPNLRRGAWTAYQVAPSRLETAVFQFRRTTLCSDCAVLCRAVGVRNNFQSV